MEYPRKVPVNISTTHFNFLRWSLAGYLFAFWISVWLSSSYFVGDSSFLPRSLLYHPLDTWLGDFPSAFAFGGVKLTVSLALVSCVLLCLGIAMGPASISLWFFWASLLDRFPVASVPHEPFVGWLLLAFSLMTAMNGESWVMSKRKTSREVSRILYLGAWGLLCASYAISALLKLSSPLWREGAAVQHILNSPVVRPWVQSSALVDVIPTGVLEILNWGALVFELAPLLLVWHPRTRFYGWCVVTTFHVINIFLFQITEVSGGLLLFQVFLWKPLQRRTVVS